MYYYSCPICHANLDPGEKCDCEKKETTSTLRKQPLLQSNNVSIAIQSTTVKMGVGDVYGR